MKKIIDGKLFSTETASCVGSDQFFYPGDVEYWREELYRKKNGEYFLHGEGGANTIYANWVGPDERSGGENIVQMDVDEAKEWAEKHIDADAYIAEFGEPEE